MEEKTYILNGVEVKLTGRKASKKRRQRRTTTTTVHDTTIYEVKPVKAEIEWSDWVSLDDLYVVESEE